MQRPVTYRILGLVVVAAGVLAALLMALRTPALRVADVLAAYGDGTVHGGATITYPLDGTLFPPEIVAPTFRWADATSGADAWVVRIEFEDDEGCLSALTRTTRWAPTDEEWEAIKRRSVEQDAEVAVIGVNHASPKRILSAARTTIRTSEDEVGAPLFYREVNLPFVDAVRDPSLIRWRFGEVSSKGAPPIVLEGLPVCGNCHSFSADGSILGMDVDYANDKGSYAIVQVDEEIVLDQDNVITWSDYERDEKELTFGLLSQISPDGRYVVSTVKDRSVFVPTPDLEFSQLFFPLKGILGVYHGGTGTFSALPGADDREYVQSNPAWSPDGQHIVFARSKAYALKAVRGKVLLSEHECREFLHEGKTFLFDLYRLPFNEGKGGRAEPLEGASHNGMSNYFAKYSPDGKWIVFCRAKSFMLLQPDSELYIMPAEGGEARRMRCNTARMNSWHSWSPNGKWLVFSSKSNGPYTQLYLTHVDSEGNDTPAVLLAQFTGPDRAANIPEFVNAQADAISLIREQFVDEVSFLRVGLQCMQSNDYVNAEQAFRKAVELDPKNVYGYNGLGIALANQGKLDEAIACYNEALRLDPDHAESHSNLGAALTTQGRLDEAVAHYAEAVRLKPKYVEAHTGMGTALAMQGKLDEAVGHHREAVRLRPGFASAHYNLAVALAMQGKIEEAVTHYRDAIRLDPDDASAHTNLGIILHRQGKLDEAIAEYTQALKVRPGLREARANLRAALQQKRRREARELQERLP